MENMTLLIDPETRDLVLDEEGHFTKIFDRDTTVQNVRHALAGVEGRVLRRCRPRHRL